jgi:hypothetical protein
MADTSFIFWCRINWCSLGFLSTRIFVNNTILKNTILYFRTFRENIIVPSSLNSRRNGRPRNFTNQSFSNYFKYLLLIRLDGGKSYKCNVYSPTIHRHFARGAKITPYLQHFIFGNASTGKIQKPEYICSFDAVWNAMLLRPFRFGSSGSL